MQTVAMARHAMATRFELVLHGANAVSLRAAGEEALDEVERLEAQLSLYQSASELSQLNQRAANGPVQVTPELFHLLQHAQRLSAETGGAFDMTMAPLMRCWGFLGGSGQLPEPAALAEAKSNVGQHLVVLDENDFTVRFRCAGVRLDLGAIGKGYALERAADILREAGVQNALLHGGTSTVHALGTQPNGELWKIAVERPPVLATAATPPARNAILAMISLRDEALSVSAVWGKSFQAGGKTLGHVLDPRTGAPAEGTLLAAVVLPSATETDALSTALLTAGLTGHDAIARLRPGMRTLVVGEVDAAGTLPWQACGIDCRLDVS